MKYDFFIYLFIGGEFIVEFDLEMGIVNGSEGGIIFFIVLSLFEVFVYRFIKI